MSSDPFFAEGFEDTHAGVVLVCRPLVRRCADRGAGSGGAEVEGVVLVGIEEVRLRRAAEVQVRLAGAGCRGVVGVGGEFGGVGGHQVVLARGGDGFEGDALGSGGEQSLPAVGRQQELPFALGEIER